MNPIRTAIKNTTLSDRITYRNLTVVPLLGRETGEPRYLTLGEALDGGSVLVKELGGGGSVPELEVENLADRPVLLLDGEELVGAKQNRVLNLSILVPAGKSIRIPVSCVEAGRWRRVTRTFSDSEWAQFARGRARRARVVSASLAQKGTPTSDQGEVWDDIAMKMSRMRAESDTGAMASIYESRRRSLGDYLSQFPLERDQIGAAFGLGPRVLGMELFDAPLTFRRLFPKILRSYAIDAEEFRGQKLAAPDLAAAESFLHSVAEAKVESYPGTGLGTTLRIDEKGLTGGGLAWEEQLVHAAAFAV